MTSISWRGREIESPLLRQLALAFLILLGAAALFAGFIIAAIGTFLTLSLAVASLPAHLVLRLLGRRGFFTPADGRFRFALGRAGSRKAP